MKAYEFSAQVTPAGTLILPASVIKQLPINQEVRVMILVNESMDLEVDEAIENEEWHRLAAEQFFGDLDEKNLT